MFSIQEKQSKESAACQSNYFSSHKEIDSWWVSSQKPYPSETSYKKKSSSSRSLVAKLLSINFEQGNNFIKLFVYWN